MKKYSFLLVLCLFSFGYAKQASGYYGIGVGMDIPDQNFDPVYNFGYGGNLLMGVQFNKYIAAQIDSELFRYTPDPQKTDGVSVGIWDARFLLELKLVGDLGGFGPYVIGGVGADYQSYSAGDTESTGFNFDTAFGGGFIFYFGDHVSLSLETKANDISFFGANGQRSPSSRSYPFSANIIFGL